MEDFSKIDIQRVSITELSLLRQTAIEAYLDHFRYLWLDDGAWYIHHSFSVDVLRKEFEDDNNLFFISFLNQEPVGFLKLKQDHALPGETNNHCMELERIYLRRSAMDKGIGKACMRLTDDLAKKKNKEIIWLKAMDSSIDSIAFYHRSGFEICGTHVLDYPLMKKEYRGMVVMKKIRDKIQGTRSKIRD